MDIFDHIDDAREPERKPQRKPEHQEILRDMPSQPSYLREPDLRDRARNQYPTRGGDYRLNQAQAMLLRDVGSFRTVGLDDLKTFIYRGDARAFDTDLKQLAQQGLIRITTAVRTKYVSLTRAGQKLTKEQLSSNREQAIYARAVKLRELKHDAKVYHMFHVEADKIIRQGGRPTRVVLDYELKRRVNKELGKAQRLSAQEQERVRQSAAAAQQLKIVAGKIQYPDLRIEYQTSGYEQSFLDLEYISAHYSGRQIAAKAAAGFRLYGDERRGRKAAPSQDIVGEILSL